MKFSAKQVSLLALAISSLAAIQPVAAQSGEASTSFNDGAIVVTAQRREELSRDVPISITSISAQQLESSGADSLADIADVTPALRFDSAGAFVQPTIRGVGTAVANSGGGSNVGIYVDGFYSPNPLSNDFELMSLKSVQVLKGPQGTLFGRNTTGGAILLTTADPSPETGAEFKASVGSFGAVRTQAYVTTGFGENFALDGEINYSIGNGFQKNIRTGNDKPGKYKNWSSRIGVLLKPSDNVELLFRWQHGEIDDPRLLLNNAYRGPEFTANGGWGNFFATPAEMTADPDSINGIEPISFTNNTDVFQGTVRADIGFADFTSYTQYRDEQARNVADLDGTAANVFGLQTFHIPVTNTAFTQEILLTSKPGQTLQWTAGLFYFQNKDTWRTRYGFPLPTDPFFSVPAGGSGTKTQSIAGFLDLTYEIMPNLFLTGGLRYSKDKVSDAYYIAVAPTQTPVPSYKADKLTPRIVVRYKPSEQSSLYASYSKGYKAGILDVGGSTGNLVQPEDINAFEVGYKYADNSFTFDLSSYYYDYKNLQVSLYTGNPPSAQIINATNSEIYGVEGQASYRMSDRLSLNVGAAYTHGRYKKFDDAPVYVAFGFTPVDLTNVHMQRTPEFTGNIGGLYSLPIADGTLDLSGNLYYTSSFFHGPSGTQFKEKGYETLSLRAQYNMADDRFHIAVYGNNVTDNRHRVQVLANALAVSAVWNEPATWGAEFGFKF